MIAVTGPIQSHPRDSGKVLRTSVSLCLPGLFQKQSRAGSQTDAHRGRADKKARKVGVQWAWRPFYPGRTAQMARTTTSGKGRLGSQTQLLSKRHQKSGFLCEILSLKYRAFALGSNPGLPPPRASTASLPAPWAMQRTPRDLLPQSPGLHSPEDPSWGRAGVRARPRNRCRSSR